MNINSKIQQIIRVDTRSNRLIVNILGSFLARFWSGVVQLLIVPLTLACLTPYEYGIWMTLSSILLWIDSFDIGLGNGLRNKLAEYAALKDWTRARQAVSTTFFALFALITPTAICLIVGIGEANIFNLLNVNATLVPNLTGIAQITLGLVCATFVFKFVGNVFLGLQLPAINNMLSVLGNTLSLLGIFFLRTFYQGHTGLMAVAIIYTISPLLVYLITYPITFLKKYPQLCPSLRAFRKDMLREIFTLGIKFFIIQLSGVVLFTTANVIISRLMGPESVTPYQIAQRYFNFAFVIFTIVITPIWSATTDAYVKGELNWIRKCVRGGILSLLFVVAIVICMTIVSQWIYPIWTLGKVQVSWTITLLMATYTIVSMLSMLYGFVLFGIGTITIQMWVTLAEALLFAPLAIACGNAWGVTGIIAAMIILSLPCLLTNVIQFHKIISGRATGLWKR